MGCQSLQTPFRIQRICADVLLAEIAAAMLMCPCVHVRMQHASVRPRAETSDGS